MTFTRPIKLATLSFTRLTLQDAPFSFTSRLVMSQVLLVTDIALKQTSTIVLDLTGLNTFPTVRNFKFIYSNHIGCHGVIAYHLS